MCMLLSEYIIKLSSTTKTFALLTDKTTDETITVVFGYILPIVLAVLFTSVACCCVHRYIHVSKQKHPTSLVCILCCWMMLPALDLTAELYIFQEETKANCK